MRPGRRSMAGPTLHSRRSLLSRSLLSRFRVSRSGRYPPTVTARMPTVTAQGLLTVRIRAPVRFDGPRPVNGRAGTRIVVMAPVPALALVPVRALALATDTVCPAGGLGTRPGRLRLLQGAIGQPRPPATRIQRATARIRGMAGTTGTARRRPTARRSTARRRGTVRRTGTARPMVGAARPRLTGLGRVTGRPRARRGVTARP